MLVVLFATTLMANAQIPEGFVSIQDVDPTIQVDLRYLGEKNFIGRPIVGYHANKCILTRAAANALKRVQTDLKKKKLGLLVFDCYRPQKAVDDFMAWTRDMSDQKNKAKYYPQVEKSKLVADGYIASRSGHSRGSTVDLTLVQLEPTKETHKKDFVKNCAHKNRKKEVGLDMGTNFDCFDELAHTIHRDVSYEALGHRKLLKSYMEQHGFSNYEKEWWHFTLKDEPHPTQTFNFDVE